MLSPEALQVANRWNKGTYDLFYLDDLVDELRAALLPRAMRRLRRVVLSASLSRRSVFGDRELVGAALRCLLGACIEYGPSCSCIWIDARDGALGRLILRLRDQEGEFSGDEPSPGRMVAPWLAIPREHHWVMGIRLCQLVAEAHGGQAWTEPAGRSGVSFLIDLPSTIDE